METRCLLLVPCQPDGVGLHFVMEVMMFWQALTLTDALISVRLSSCLHLESVPPHLLSDKKLHSFFKLLLQLKAIVSEAIILAGIRSWCLFAAE